MGHHRSSERWTDSHWDWSFRVCRSFFIICYNIIFDNIYIFKIHNLQFVLQSNLVITRSSGGIFWDRGISEARYRFCRQVFFCFVLILYVCIFFYSKLHYLLCTLPRCTFTTHYVYCIFIRICFIALSKRNQNTCPKQVGFCLCSASHCWQSMTVLAKQTTPLALCCLRSLIKVDVPNKWASAQ